MKYLKELGLILILLLALIILALFNHSNPAEGAVKATNEITNNTTKDPNIPGVKKIEILPDQYKPIRVPVFMYHQLGDVPAKHDQFRVDLTVSASNFDDQMKFLSDHGYQCISSKELLKYAQGEITFQKKPCMIVLDDGYDDAFKIGVPILKKYNMVGTFAVITQYAGNQDYASWDTISAAYKDGMDIVPHSQHHIDFISRQYDHLTRVMEIQGAVKDIHDHLGIDSVVFVYPYGHYNSETKEIVKDTGLKFAFTTRFGIFDTKLDPYEQPRIRVHGKEDLASFGRALLKAELKF